MARNGILYSDVENAAAKLTADGKVPTVDNVRAAMGGTGSKSTIAPMLKRWKLDHQEAMASGGTGLPANLVQAVKVIYEHLQKDAERKVQEAREEHQKQADQKESVYQALLEEKNALLLRVESQNAELQQRSKTVADLQSEKQATTLIMASLESECAGVKLRLNDRSNEVNLLQQQLRQAQAQFEHFQASTANQRQEENQRYEERISRTEQALIRAEEKTVAQYTKALLLETSATQLRQENTQLREALTALTDKFTVTNSEKEKFQLQANQLTSTVAELANKLEISQRQLTDFRIAIATADERAKIADTLRLRAEEKVELLAAENKAQLSGQANLQLQETTRILQEQLLAINATGKRAE